MGLSLTYVNILIKTKQQKLKIQKQKYKYKFFLVEIQVFLTFLEATKSKVNLMKRKCEYFFSGLNLNKKMFDAIKTRK